MKKMQALGLLTVLSLTFVFGAAHAITNPLHRYCLPEGYLWTLQSEVGELPLCLMNQQAPSAIGAAEIFQLKTRKEKSLSIQLFLSLPNKNNAEENCLKQKGQVVPGGDTQGKAWKVCVLPDQSSVDLETLARGYNDSANQTLKDLLLNY